MAFNVIMIPNWSPHTIKKIIRNANDRNIIMLKIMFFIPTL